MIVGPSSPLAGLALVGVAAGLVGAGRSALQATRVRHRLDGILALRPVGAAATGADLAASWARVVALARRVGARADEETEHAAVLEAVARTLRAGGSLGQGVADAARSLPPGRAVLDLLETVRGVATGVPLGAALSRWSDADDHPARVLAGSALTLGAELGGASARSLDAAAGVLRDRAALGREVRALTSQARASAVVMVTAPLGFVVVAGATDRRVVATLLTTPTGLACVASGLALDALGAAWMARLTRGAS